jgi:hypothetical protein
MLFNLSCRSALLAMGSPLIAAAGLSKIESKDGLPRLSPPCQSSNPVNEKSRVEKRRPKIKKGLGFFAPEMASHSEQ